VRTLQLVVLRAWSRFGGINTELGLLIAENSLVALPHDDKSHAFIH
jgi:hypothetical protein